MAFISFNSRVAEHRTRLVCLGETPSPRVRCQLALFTYLLTYRDREKTRARWASCRRRCGMRLDHWNSAVGAGGGGPLDGLG